MKTSEKCANVLAAFVLAQQRVGVAIKTAENSHLKSRYADLGAVWDAVTDALRENNLAVMQMPVGDSAGRLRLETVLVHTSGEWVSSEIDMPLTKQDPQAYGSAMTYARRYGLAALMGVTQDDEDGERATASANEERALDLVEAMKTCETLAELQEEYLAASRELKGDKNAVAIIVKAKNSLKKELEAKNGSANA